LKKINKYIDRNPFLIKLFNWEYWPFNVIYFPIFLYWLFLSIKARSLFFFRAVNPAIETGGMLGESKISILDQIPQEYKPVTILLKKGATFDQTIKKMHNYDIKYPVILKPDVGERGWKVEKIENDLELKKYLEKNKFNILLQDFVDLPVELAVMYYRFPDQSEGKINSITIKEFLTVKGNNNSSVEELIRDEPRALLQLETLKEKHPDLMKEIPASNEILELVPIGNHCRGTKFINGNNLIDKALILAFDKIAIHLPDVYFCRFDMKCNSIEELREAKSIRIMEINGVGAEPAHIYDPGYKLIDAYRDLLEQWNIIYKISRINRKNGASYMTLREALRTLKTLSQYRKMAEAA